MLASEDAAEGTVDDLAALGKPGGEVVAELLELLEGGRGRHGGGPHGG